MSDRPIEYHKVAKTSEIDEGEATQVLVGRREIAIYNLDGNFFATDDICTHAYASLADGYIEDDVIECPLHGGSFEIKTGETMGLVGESGCGKSTTARTLIRLLDPTSGDVWFRSEKAGAVLNVATAGREELRAVREDIQIVFQDPYASLNPRMTVGSIVGEPLWIHRVSRGSALTDRVVQLLRRVGLPPEAGNRYPHEFSGGQRQRIGIARALALEPAFIVCDEPTSALDVSIRAQIINLLAELQEELGISYLMISHDLAVVRHISHAVAVMYLGKIVEQAPTEQLYEDPRHPYSEVLLSAIPVPDPTVRRKHIWASDGDAVPRSEERRVGKECRSRWSPYH